MPEVSPCRERGGGMELALINDGGQCTPNTDLGIIFILTPLFADRGLESCSEAGAVPHANACLSSWVPQTLLGNRDCSEIFAMTYVHYHNVYQTS